MRAERSAAARPVIPRDLAIVAAASLLILLPFSNKPLSADDPPYVWVARQISVHPLDFYGFKANWYGTLRPMFEFDENPPLGSYYIALIGSLSNWRLSWIHLGLDLSAVTTAIGMYFLAGEYCLKPLWAALLLLACPAFLVSATSLMYDVPMLCFWTWAVFAWVRGSGGRSWLFPVSGLCMAVAVLTKYPALSLLPLLIAHMAIHRQTWTVHLVQILSLLIPVAAIAGLEWFTTTHYGHHSLWGAASYSRGELSKHSASTTMRTLDALAYLGGGVITAAMVVTVASGRKMTCIFLALAGVLTWTARVLIHHADGWSGYASIARAAGIAAVSDGRPAWGFDIQFGILAAAGVVVLIASVVLCIQSTAGRQRRDCVLLLLWIGGVFVFAACLNWAINVRSLLPMLPAVCIVAVKIIEHRPARVQALPVLVTAIVGGLLAITVAFGDYQLAVANRNAAGSLERPGHRVWFSGHWGFQYYMQEHGGLPLDEISTVIAPGDFLVVPLNNYGSPHLDGMMLVGKLEVDPGIGVTTQSLPLGATFYGSDGNQLPFVIGSVPAEPFLIFKSLTPKSR